MTVRNLLCLLYLLLSGCGFPSREMTKNLNILKSNFTSLHNAVLNEKIDSSIVAKTKLRIPYYSEDLTIRRLLTEARVHNYEVIDSTKIVRLDWPGEEYSYYIFIGSKNKLINHQIQNEQKCKSVWIGDSVLLQRYYTPLVLVY
jgi:hypothetical protein